MPKAILMSNINSLKFRCSSLESCSSIIFSVFLYKKNQSSNYQQKILFIHCSMEWAQEISSRYVASQSLYQHLAVPEDHSRCFEEGWPTLHSGRSHVTINLTSIGSIYHQFNLLSHKKKNQFNILQIIYVGFLYLARHNFFFFFFFLFWIRKFH